MRRTTTLLVLALAAGCATPSTAAHGLPAPAAASLLPDFELATVDGDRVRLSDLLGRKVVVLAFWDTWCEPCKTELPHLNDIYQAHRKDGLAVLAVSMDDPSTVVQVAPFVHEQGFAFPVLLDPSGTAAGLYDTHKSAPYTVVIGRDGTIASEASGYEPGAEKPLEAEIVKLLAAKPR